jgi:hypothetical protein
VDPEAASEVLRDVRMLDRKIVDLNARVEAEVEASRTTLTQIFGVARSSAWVPSWQRRSWGL